MVRDDDVERLLQPETRAALPLLTLVRIYLDPFVLFKNVNAGNIFNQRAARAYNTAMRWVLVDYMRRWSFRTNGWRSRSRSFKLRLRWPP